MNLLSQASSIIIITKLVRKLVLKIYYKVEKY